MSIKSDIESGSIPDKGHLYGRFLEWESWRNSLSKKLAHKALDIMPDDDMNINQTRTGMGWKELGIIAAMIGGVGFGAYQLGTPDSVPQPAVTQPNQLSDSEYEVRFFDAQGNPITVPHISTLQQKEPGQ